MDFDRVLQGILDIGEEMVGLRCRGEPCGGQHLPHV